MADGINGPAESEVSGGGNLGESETHGGERSKGLIHRYANHRSLYSHAWRAPPWARGQPGGKKGGPRRGERQRVDILYMRVTAYRRMLGVQLHAHGRGAGGGGRHARRWGPCVGLVRAGPWGRAPPYSSGRARRGLPTAFSRPHRPELDHPVPVLGQLPHATQPALHSAADILAAPGATTHACRYSPHRAELGGHVKPQPPTYQPSTWPFALVPHRLELDFPVPAPGLPLSTRARLNPLPTPPHRLELDLPVPLPSPQSALHRS